ncbi:UNVERIFIED_ORG: hypothetical protein ABIC48_003836 [Burkholderia territorii]
MEHLRKSHSISSLVKNWSNEEPGDLQFELLHAIANGLLVVTDPLVDASVLDTESEVEQFLAEHPDYQRGYWLSGDEVVFRRDFLTAIWEYIEYGSPKTVALATLYAACNYLCIRKTDFLQYLKKQRRSLPAFWFSSAERTVLADVSNEDLGSRLSRIESELDARRGIPSLLDLWFLHDTWTRQQGLMLMSGLSPSTRFDYEYNTFDDRIREISYLETLDGLEHDPRDGHTYEQRLAFYESLWDSGDHPPRAKPQYFVDWAVAKRNPPAWLDWAISNKLLNGPSESGNSATNGFESTLRELCGGHETVLLTLLIKGAVEWWSSYDPSDKSTAPKAEDVTAWFVKQGASSRVAEVMAQILRADGLPTGPRGK